MDLAMATRTHPHEWLDAPPEMVATALEWLDRQAKQARRRR